MRALVMILAAMVLAGCSHAARSDPASAPTSQPATAPASLAGTKWNLLELNGKPARRGENDTVVAWLEFDAKTNRVGGNGSINHFGGTYTLNGHSIEFSDMMSTMMAGPEPLMNQESALMKVLEDAKSWRTRDGKLELLAGDNVLARFEKR